MTMKKLLTCVLALLLLAGSFAGCGENTDTPDAAGSGEKDTDMDSPEITETDLPETELSDELPEKDYGAVDFNVLVRQEFLYEFSSDLTGEVVDDAIYNRNAEVGERFNLNLQIKDVTGSWSTQETFKSTIRNSVMAQDGEFDMIAASANYAMAMAGEGLFTNLHDCEYLDFTKPWWDAGFTDNMQVGGNLYLATGDIALTSIENMCVFLFNKQLAANYAVGDLYAMVRQGTWTWENMAAIAEGCYSDLDANGVMDSADQYGLLTYGNMIRAMVQSFEIPYTARDENGFPTVTFMSERLVNAAEMVTAFVQDSAACWDYSLNNYGDTLDIATAMQTYFSQNQAMFLSQVLSSAEVLRTMTVDFGILPYPKMDETQERYYTTVLENVTAMGILTTTKDLEMSGIVMEAMAAYGNKEISPAYYEVALKSKYARDEESAEMLNIIKASTWYDFGYINSTSLGGINSFFQTVVEKDQEMVSYWESQKNVVNAGLESLLEAYRK